jgi:hypothetical protein
VAREMCGDRNEIICDNRVCVGRDSSFSHWFEYQKLSCLYLVVGMQFPLVVALPVPGRLCAYFTLEMRFGERDIGGITVAQNKEEYNT